MAGLFERMGLVRTEYEGIPEIPMQPVSEPMYAPETPVIDATVGNGNTKMVADPGSADAYLNRRTDVFFKIIEE